MSYGLLLVRVVIGTTMFAHGAQKLFGWFGGPGLRGTAGQVCRLGKFESDGACETAVQRRGV